MTLELKINFMQVVAMMANVSSLIVSLKGKSAHYLSIRMKKVDEFVKQIKPYLKTNIF